MTFDRPEPLAPRVGADALSSLLRPPLAGAPTGGTAAGERPDPGKLALDAAERGGARGSADGDGSRVIGPCFTFEIPEGWRRTVFPATAGDHVIVALAGLAGVALGALGGGWLAGSIVAAVAGPVLGVLALLAMRTARRLAREDASELLFESADRKLGAQLFLVPADLRATYLPGLIGIPAEELERRARREPHPSGLELESFTLEEGDRTMHVLHLASLEVGGFAWSAVFVVDTEGGSPPRSDLPELIRSFTFGPLEPAFAGRARDAIARVHPGLELEVLGPSTLAARDRASGERFTIALDDLRVGVATSAAATDPRLEPEVIERLARSLRLERAAPGAS